MALKLGCCFTNLVKISRYRETIGTKIQFRCRLTLICSRTITYTQGCLEQSSAEPKYLTAEDSKTKSGFLDYFRTFLLSENATGEEIHFLINSCGPRMSKESRTSRDQLLQHVWQELEKHNVKLGIGLWNLRLRKHIENGCNICPRSFLQEMDKAIFEVEANHSTLELLLNIYGAQGDVSNTRQVISSLMSQQGKLTEDSYGSLLQAYAKRGDTDSVKVVLDSLVTNDFPITHLIYGYILKGYADIGDMKRIDNTIRDMIGKGLRPTVDVYIGLFEHLSYGHHFDQLERSLAKIESLMMLVPRLRMLVEQFVADGLIESAFIVLKELQGVKGEEELYKVLLYSKRDIFEYARALKVVERKSNGVPFSRLHSLVHFLHLHHSTEAVLELFKYMMSECELSNSDVVKVLDTLYDGGYTEIVNVADILQIDLQKRSDPLEDVVKSDPKK